MVKFDMHQIAQNEALTSTLRKYVEPYYYSLYIVQMCVFEKWMAKFKI